jgi:gamma-glutamylputrescine oxidase
MSIKPQTKPINETFWYLAPESIETLTQDVTVDLVIVGGGMAGLSAAQAAAARGLKVAIVEKYFCGSGASGKSSGFMSPDAEFSFSDLVRMKGPEHATHIWNFICSGVETIRSTITTHAIKCDYEVKDTLVLASTVRSLKKLEHEHTTRLHYGYDSTFYTAETVNSVVNGVGYHGGYSYNKTFSIKSFAYCQALKKILQQQGVLIFEESPVVEVSATGVRTMQATITAQKIIIATDYHAPELAPALKYDAYHVQTFLAVSAPLPETATQQLFPGKPVMAWDTDLIYHYFRLTADNRLLIGGANIFETYASRESYHNNFVFKNLSGYAHQRFPQLPLQWEYMWPGLIGITKDLFPLAGKDKDHPHIYYISCAGGLPWACALGNYAIDALYENRSELDQFFNPYRRFLIPHAIQAVIGTKLTFALCNFKEVSSL